jgi:hypothetical protein
MSNKKVIGKWVPKENNLSGHGEFEVVSKRQCQTACREDPVFEGHTVDGEDYHVYTEYWTFIPVEEYVVKEEKKEFKAMKFRVNSPEESRALQEWLFKQKYKWKTQVLAYRLNNYVQVCQNTKCAFLFTNEYGTITYNTIENGCYFLNSDHTEYTFTAKLSVVDVQPVVKRSVVNVGGVEYYEDELNEALALVRKAKKEG